MFVVDASVAIKWFIQEKDSEKAILLKEKHINGNTVLIAPDLLIYEVANVLAFSKMFSPAEAKRCLFDLYDLEIDLINPSIDIIPSAIELAADKRLSVYDSCYLALARELDIKLITADEKLFRSVGENSCVELLSNI